MEYPGLRRRLSGLLAALMLLLVPVAASAVTVGTYDLSNHPGANQTPPPYGMRLDGLLGHNVYTFDFGHASSSMQMVYDTSGTSPTIHIFGTAYGGSDTGSGYAGGSTAVWTIDFLFDVGVTQPGGEGGLDDVVVNASGNHANFGSVTSSLGNFDLRSHSAGAVTFQLGDEDGTGHRNFAGISGWGWLDYSVAGLNDWKGQDTGKTADFIFTASPVPLPAAVWLLGSGLVLLGGVARRRRSA